MSHFICIRCAFLLTSLILIAGPSLRAQEKQSKQEPANAAVPDPKAKEKPITFEMRNAPWTKVFEWLSDHTGLPLISTNELPPGTFTFVSPKAKLYDSAQIIEIVESGAYARHPDVATQF